MIPKFLDGVLVLAVLQAKRVNLPRKALDDTRLLKDGFLLLVDQIPLRRDARLVTTNKMIQPLRDFVREGFPKIENNPWLTSRGVIRVKGCGDFLIGSHDPLPIVLAANEFLACRLLVVLRERGNTRDGIDDRLVGFTVRFLHPRVPDDHCRIAYAATIRSTTFHSGVTVARCFGFRWEETVSDVRLNEPRLTSVLAAL